MKIDKVVCVTLLLIIGLFFLYAGTTATNLETTKGWAINFASTDASGCEEIKAATSGKSIYLRQLSINCNADITVTIGAGEASSAVSETTIGPVTFDAASCGFAHWDFLEPIKLTEGYSLTVDASNTGVVHVFVAGYTK